MLTNEIKEILAECYKDDKLFCKTFFPEAFNGPFTVLHDTIFDLIQSKERLVALAAPRGIGKTTTVSAKAAKNILYRDSLFIPYVSKSESAAMLQTENLKRSLSRNPIIRKMFGSVKPKNIGDEFAETFSKKSWVGFDSLIVPRGYTQQLRGLLYDNKRPDLFIIDDLEDDEFIENPVYRKELRNWFFSVLMKAVSRYSNNWRIIYIDTLKHEDSLLQMLLDSPEWASARLELCDDNCKSLVPEIISDEEIKADYERHDRDGLLDIFYREYRNLPMAGKNAMFQKKHFQYITMEELMVKRDVEYVVLADPAKTITDKSADSAIICVGIDTRDNAIYFADCEAGKFLPDQIYDHIFDMAIRWGAHTIAVETTSLHEFIEQPLKNELIRRGLNMEFVWLQARGGSKKEEGKNNRIGSLAPYYRQGLIYHRREISAKLETQLLSFPRSKLKDVMDVFGYTIQLLDIGDRYFEPAEGELEDDEDIYDDLEYDEPLDFAEWGVI